MYTMLSNSRSVASKRQIFLLILCIITMIGCLYQLTRAERSESEDRKAENCTMLAGELEDSKVKGLIENAIVSTDLINGSLPPFAPASVQNVPSQHDMKKFWAFGNSNPDQLILPFVDFDRGYTIAPAHSISFCCVKKSMSTLTMGIACALYNTKEFMAANQSITGFWDEDRFCLDKNEHFEMGSVEEVMERKGVADFAKVTMVREPIERFISFFVDKCIKEAANHPHRCYDCKGNLRCFLDKQYERLVHHSLGRHPVLKPSYEDHHAAPLSWSCEFGRYLKEYKIVKMSADREDRKEGIEHLLDILRAQNVSDSTLDFFRTSALSGDTTHATYASDAHKTVQQQIETDREIRQLLKKIYYYDFLIFGFDTTFINS